MPMTEEARMKHRMYQRMYRQRRKERLLAGAEKGDEVALRTIAMDKARNREYQRRHTEKHAERILAKRRERYRQRASDVREKTNAIQRQYYQARKAEE